MEYSRFFNTNDMSVSDVMLTVTEGRTARFNIKTLFNAITPETLEKAVREGNIKLAKICLEAGLSPDGMPSDTLNGEDHNLLSLSIQKMHPQMTDLLLEYKANPNGTTETNSIGLPVLSAVRYGDIDAMKKFFRRGADLDNKVEVVHEEEHKKYYLTLFTIALDTYYGLGRINDDIVQFLLNNALGCTQMKSVCVEYVGKREFSVCKMPSIDLAIRHQDFELVKRICECGHAVYDKDLGYDSPFDPLNRACEVGNIKIADYLIQKGAPVRYEIKVCDGNGTESSAVVARGVKQVIDRDDANMLALLMHYGVCLSDRIYTDESTTLMDLVRRSSAPKIQTMLGTKDGYKDYYKAMKRILSQRIGLSEEQIRMRIDAKINCSSEDLEIRRMCEALERVDTMTALYKERYHINQIQTDKIASSSRNVSPIATRRVNRER